MARKSEDRLEQINIHLLKSEITDFKNAIAYGKSPKHISASADVLPNAVLYFEDPPKKPSSWRSFLAPGFSTALPQFDAKHASALLFFQAGNSNTKRSFAVTLGYGRALLSESALEPDFGLRTALNLCNPDTLRAVNYRTIEERTRITRTQLSDAGSVDAFRINMDTDLLRGLEAESNNKDVCERLGARWSNLIVAARVEIGDLPTLATKLLGYRKKKLPTQYAWIDNVRRVTDPSCIQSLDAELEHRVKTKQFDGIRLAIPEITGSTVGIDAKLFEPTTEAEDFTSDFNEYLNKRKKQVEWSVQSAKMNQRVYLIDTGSGAEREHTPVYRCIVAEFDHDGNRYLLIDGEWFLLNPNFVNLINKAMTQIPHPAHSLPAWTGEKEGDWNKHACVAWKDAALLDKSNPLHGGGGSKIEPADIVTKAGLFGHVKRRDKSSSGLSHLFAQGVVSARLIKQDADFRKKVAKCIPSSHKGLCQKLNGTSFDARKWTVSYIILGADTAKPAETLPFFSKVNLRGAIQQLKDMEYNVGIIGV
ncbi:MAG: TIGR04141 family sporadically distributed protein [Phycisphaeraceae bacterium]|nr:TIGR04141 family sporadically distributed protein [Phycisphaeraceae bacterium]